MNNLWLIFKREYLIRVRKKSFIFLTILTPILILALYALPAVFMQFSGEEYQIALKDDSGFFENKLKDGGKAIFTLKKESLESLQQNYAEKYDGLLYIPQFNNLNGELNIQYYSEKQLSLSTIDFIEDEVSERIRTHKMQAAGITTRQLDDLKANVSLEQKDLSKTDDGMQEKDSKTTAIIASGMGFAMGFFMYMVIFIYGGMVMKSVMEEKTNRIVEVMISTVKPFELMLGKILGVSAVGLTQLLIWAIAIPLVLFAVAAFVPMDVESMQAASEAANGMDQEEMQAQAMSVMQMIMDQNWWKIIPLLIFYFLGGYFIYASLFAAVGSAVSDDLGESQQLTLPIALPVMIAFFMMFAIIDNPNSSLATWSSIFPLFSPITMPARLAFDPPWWEIILSMVTLLGTAIFFVWMSGRIYRIGILMYGKKVTFKEIWKWLFYKG